MGMAGQAIFVAHPFVIEDLARFMRLMAIDADGNFVGSFSQSSPLMTLRCTCSIRAWHFRQVATTLSRLMDDLGSVCGSTSCAVMAARAHRRDRQALL